jgi:NTE family protein
VDATTGEARVFDRHSGVDLVHAVAASCAVPMVWPPVPIDGVPHVDGGVRSPANADLAAGADRVVVLAPLLQAATRSGTVKVQLARLGPRVRSGVLSPDAGARAAIGRNVLDPARRADAARAGVRQGVEVADRVRAVWSDA